MKQNFTNNNQLKIGDIAPNFKAVNGDVADVELADFNKEYKVIIAVPSIDTGVCDQQAKKFNEELGKRDDIDLITISKDLPFAQSRWCAAGNVENLTMLSDYKYNDFAEKYGLLLEELRLIGRAVIILNKNNEVIYSEYCENVPDHPNYDEAFKILNK